MNIQRPLACLLCLSVTMILTAAEKKEETEPLQDRAGGDKSQSSFSTKALEDEVFLPWFERVKKSSSPVEWTPWILSQDYNCNIYSISLSREEALSVTYHDNKHRKTQWWSATHVKDPEERNRYSCSNAAILGNYLKEQWEKRKKK